MEQGDKRSHPAFRRNCYTDEKPVFFMSMFAFFIIFVLDGQKSSSSSSSFILHNYCRPRLPSLASVPFEISIDSVIAGISKKNI